MINSYYKTQRHIINPTNLTLNCVWDAGPTHSENDTAQCNKKKLIKLHKHPMGLKPMTLPSILLGYKFVGSAIWVHRQHNAINIKMSSV